MESLAEDRVLKMKILSFLLSLPIHAYRRFLSPLTPPCCRYYPSCSTYAVEALHVHGPIKGLLLAGWRLLRCNPWSLGGVDHVPPRGQWKAEEWCPPHDWVGHLDLDPPFPMGMERIGEWNDGSSLPHSDSENSSEQTGHTPRNEQASPEHSGLTVDAISVHPS